MSENKLVKDESMDISSLIKSSKANADNSPAEELSPLEKMAKEKANGGGGLVVNTADLEAPQQKPLIQNKTLDDAEGEIDETLKDMDDMIASASKARITRVPSNPIEMVQLMDAVAEHQATGRDVIDPETGEVIIRHTDGTEEELVNEVESDENNDEVSDDTGSVADNPEKSKIINFLIDKTGFGADFFLSPDEREKVKVAEELRITEVKEVRINKMKVKKPKKSFTDTVNAYQIGKTMVPVVFPASRFKAYMTGLSFGEMGDLTLNTESATTDHYRKKLTVIYNKMVNPSIGKFKDFEDFLRKFAHTDIDIATYGLIVASFPEEYDLPMDCNKDTCKKSFNQKFNPRSLIDFNKCGDRFLEAMKEIIECPEAKLPDLVNDSPVVNHVQYELPYSKFIVEVGIASAYDYLYYIIDNLLGDKFQENHPDDVNNILQLNATLLTLVRAVYVPDDDGEYIEYTSFEDMIQALYMIKPEEIAFLSNLLLKFQEGYSVKFSLKNVECPHCHTKTEEVDVDLNYLLFHRYQRLMNTTIDTNNITVL